MGGQVGRRVGRSVGRWAGMWMGGWVVSRAPITNVALSWKPHIHGQSNHFSASVVMEADVLSSGTAGSPSERHGSGLERTQ